ncbi:hypothetical protein pb186bvf_009066 [Paramecium bursaria]
MDNCDYYFYDSVQQIPESNQYINFQQNDDGYENQFYAEQLNQQNFQQDNHTKYNTTFANFTKELTTQKIASLKKNFPKTVCNNLRKYLKTLPDLTIAMTQFIEKKQINDQAKYTIEDLRTLCQDPKSQQIVVHYMINFAYIDIICSDKVEYPEQYIELIEHFVQGCLTPQHFICNKRTEK